MASESISPAQARRVALAAQGFTDPAPTGTPDLRHLRRVLRRTGLLQIDSVNVLQRAHYLPLYSRLGPYPTALLDRSAYRAPRELFEYWGHEASLLPLDLHPLLRWRMARGHGWGGPARLARERPDLISWVREEVAARGPVTAGQIEQDVPRRKDHWGWNWSDVKTALEWLFWCGEVLVSHRDNGFARFYDLPERVLPARILDTPTPDPVDAYRELVRRSAAALGVSAEAELRDYFRLPAAVTRTAVSELVEAGELRPVTVPGWRHQGYLHRDAKLPRRIGAATLLSPFDPVVWHRGRTERLFDFFYRIEIYVPAEQRVHGYYVLPFLLGDQLVARVDLKADRRAGVLRVPAVWAEPGPAAAAGRVAAGRVPTARIAGPAAGVVAEALATELHRLAGWLGLPDVAPPERGDLATALTAALRRAEPAGGPAHSAAVPVYGEVVDTVAPGGVT